MSKNVLLSSLLLASVAFSGTALAANEPSLHQVYEAANAGRLSEAQGMMDQVLHNHPGSAKAHFVEAEILERGGRLAKAQSELATAERLAPGLPFAKPESVEKLKRHLSAGSAQFAPVAAQAPVQFAPATAQASGGIPWSMVLLGLGLIAALIFFVRSLGRRSVLPARGGAAYPTPYAPGMASQPYGAGAPTMGPAAGGMGSGILGGLATGAAVGAGIVAGEALMHHFTDSSSVSPLSAPLPAPADNWSAPPDDMGGSDFGISDGSSWDDGSSGGGDW